jgi:alpha-ketoglutarate-dependent taurine dioxygenase
MKTRSLKNYDASVGVEAYDIDWNSAEELVELGKLVAGQCIVLVDQQVPTETLSTAMCMWGDSSDAIFPSYIRNKKLTGRHWRELFLILGEVVAGLPRELYSNVTNVTYQRDAKGNATGLFPKGELDWHSDQCSFDDAQRVIGLQSISDTVNSQTKFVCTHDAFESLSTDTKSEIKTLFCKHVWRAGLMAPGLDSRHQLLARCNMIPLDGMETAVYQETATGLSGIKLPTHTYDRFVGMTQQESDKLYNELRRVILQEKYIYTQHWQDGQIVFMDQEITLHCRPTNIEYGNKRLMKRCINYVNNILPNQPREYTIRYNGKNLTFDEMAAQIDQIRREEFAKTGYVSDKDEVVFNV